MLTLVSPPTHTHPTFRRNKASGLFIWNQLGGTCNLSALDQPVDLGQSSTIMKHDVSLRPIHTPLRPVLLLL